MSDTLKAYFALLAVNVIYGANYLIARDLMPAKIGPSGFIILRVGGALLLFGAAIVFVLMQAHGMDARPRLPLRAHWSRFVFCGLTGVAVNQLLFFNGLSLTSPVNSAVIMTSNPLLVLLMSAFILRERISATRWAGVLLGSIGAIMLIRLSSSETIGTANPQGDVMILINSLSYAVYLVTVRPLLKVYSPLTVIFWVFVIGALAVVPFGSAQLTTVQWTELTRYDWVALIYVIAGSTFLAYLLNIYALQHVPASVASGFIYLQPLLAGMLSMLPVAGWSVMYAKDLSPERFMCGLLICVGVWLVTRRK